MEYLIDLHKHRYAAWAAGRAANTSTCRFNVLQGKRLIESIGLHRLGGDPEQLPAPGEIDAIHRAWRESAICHSAELSLTGFGHGVAAKLINVYLKGIFVCGGHEDHSKVGALHPPIDSLLLNGLYGSDEPQIMALRGVWKRARQIRWSKFGSLEYEDVISAVRSAMTGRPLWEIERYWPGNR